MSRARRRPWLLAALLAALVAAVATQPRLQRDVADSARAVALHVFGLGPRALYALRLKIAGMADTEAGRGWQRAVARAQARAVEVGRRYKDRVRFTGRAPLARVYALELARGAELAVRLTRVDAGAGRLFAELERRHDRRWQALAILPADGRVYRHVVARDGRFRVVLQPSLLAAPRVRVAIASGGSLAFPVVGGQGNDIGGGFGAPRDGGARQHKGVDIFAARGTAVRAVVAGRVRRDRSGIGGNHIWLSPPGLGFGRARFYYAHLAGFAVADGARVDAGQIIGRVGNTGNARTTPPHLHFGIYTSGGAVDPAPFIQPPPDLPGDRR